MSTAAYNPEESADAAGRHWRLGLLCDDFHHIIAGQEAERLLADIDSLPEAAGVWVAPSWVWIYSGIKLGRKELSKNTGQRMRMPARAMWNTGTVVIVAEHASLHAMWSFAGLGHSGYGTTTVTTGSTTTDHTDHTTLPDRIEVEILTKHQIVARLEELVATGKQARWNAITYLETHVADSLRRAHHSVTMELAATAGEFTVVVDDTKLETIADHMLLGDEAHPGKVSQLLDRCLAPRTFENVEPLKYIKQTLRRDANTEIRRAIGDPHIGPKVRRVAADLGTRDLDTIIAAYRVRYPQDRLSSTRAAEAMNVGPDAMAGWQDVHALADRHAL